MMNWFSKWFKKKRISDLTEEDYLNLGAKLVGVLSVSIEPDIPSVNCLKTLAKNWNLHAKERTIDLEIFLFHKFLLVQSLPLQEASPIVSSNVLWGFYAALEVIMKDHKSPLYVSQFIRSRIKTNPEELAKLEKVWVTRAKYYEEPFELDLQEWLEKGKGKGHVPWERTITRFMSFLRKSSGETNEAMRATDGFMPACVAVTVTFGSIYCKQCADIISDT